MPKLLDTPAGKLFEPWLVDCAAVGVDTAVLRPAALAALAYHRAPAAVRERATLSLEKRWYASLIRGEPDYDVYGDSAYLADLWACWIVYSRRYLRAIRSDRSLPERGSVLSDLAAARSVCDLGCGFGYTTAALVELFPTATVTATNLDGTEQTAVTRRVGARCGFAVAADPSDVGPVDLVFASEYFEHFAEPAAHLADVLSALRPRALLIANAFGGHSIGHFPRYRIGTQLLEPRTASRSFNATLRRAGYQKVETRLWNARPSYWRLDARPA